MCAVAFNASGELCATADMNGVIKVWRTKNCSLMIELNGPEEVEWMQFHPKVLNAVEIQRLICRMTFLLLLEMTTVSGCGCCQKELLSLYECECLLGNGLVDDWSYGYCYCWLCHSFGYSMFAFESRVWMINRCWLPLRWITH